MRACARCGIVLGVLWAAGCGDGLGLGPPEGYERPTVAVLRFDNRAPAFQNWRVGDGTRDILVDRLMATGRYEVVERADLGAVEREIKLQKSGATREQSRAAQGRLKNAQYLIKGTVTDFAQVAANRGNLGLGGLDIFGGGSRAVVGITVQVVDVESGQVLFSRAIQESVRAGDASVQAGYKNVSMGGSTFYRTPMGQATEKVIDKAVIEITRAIASCPWAPQVAQVARDGTILISGGLDRRLAAGGEYEVLEAGEPVLDPGNGDVIGHGAGMIVGRLRVVQVWAGYSEAVLVSGDLADIRVGQRCRRVPAVAAR